jgi:hypothetical protein
MMRTKAQKISVLTGHFVLSNGKLIGSWRRGAQRKDSTALVCTLIAKPTRAELDALDAEIRRFGEFLGTPLRLEITRR